MRVFDAVVAVAVLSPCLGRRPCTCTRALTTPPPNTKNTPAHPSSGTPTIIASGAADGSVVTWHAKDDYAALGELKDCSAAISALAWTRDAHTLYAASLDRTLRVYGQ